jgi:hypothetical protein
MKKHRPGFIFPRRYFIIVMPDKSSRKKLTLSWRYLANHKSRGQGDSVYFSAT